MMMPDTRDILDTTSGNGLSRSSFSLKNRIARAFWMVTWAALARWTPAPLHAWRRFLLIAFGARVGAHARIYGSATIWYPPNLDVGRHATIGPNVNVYCQGPITIDEYAVVSQGAQLVAGTHDVDHLGFQLRVKPIHVGKYSWVAASAFVGPGVIIGDGAVLGACGVAFGNLLPWTVYVGNPAHVLRERPNFLADGGSP